MSIDGGFRHAALVRPWAQRISHYSAQAADRGLQQGSPSVPGPLLPADASTLDDALEMPIALGQRTLRQIN